METAKNILVIAAMLVAVGVFGALFEWARKPDLGNDCVYRTRNFDKPYFSEPRQKNKIKKP